MGGKQKRGKKQGQSSSSSSCNGHKGLYKILESASDRFGPSDALVLRRRGITLLHLAAKEEDLALDLAQAILTCGCIPINSQTLDDGCTPLFIAAHNGQVNMVRLLLDQEGVGVNIRQKDQATPLQAAASLGYAEIVKLLLGCEDIDANLADNFGLSPLHCAVRKNYEVIVQMLLTCVTIDVNTRQNLHGATPLHIASNFGYAGVVQLLVGHKDLAPNLQDNVGSTAICEAVGAGHVEIVKLLLSCEGIDINKHYANLDPKLQYVTTIMVAARFGEFEIVKMLIESNLINDINAKDNTGQSALLMAVQGGDSKTVNILLNYKGIDVNAIDKDGMTALHAASILKRPEVVKVLLASKKININAETHSHSTPLHSAAKIGDIEIVRMLLEFGKKNEHFDIEKKNLAGQTALSLAQRGNHTGVAGVITKHIKKMERRKRRDIKYESELQEAIAALDTLD